jgi:hypothetical protein
MDHEQELPGQDEGASKNPSGTPLRASGPWWGDAVARISGPIFKSIIAWSVVLTVIAIGAVLLSGKVEGFHPPKWIRSWVLVLGAAFALATAFIATDEHLQDEKWNRIATRFSASLAGGALIGSLMSNLALPLMSGVVFFFAVIALVGVPHLLESANLRRRSATPNRKQGESPQSGSPTSDR